MTIPDALTAALDRKIRGLQADRLPSVAAAVVRGGETIWTGAVGTADYDGAAPATPETQYRIGSITKTFTAVTVMQLRDAGKLDLDDRLDVHLPGVTHGSPTIRRMLCHLSGLQREAGEMFVTGEAPSIDEIIAAMYRYELVLPAAKAHHYSNLAFGLLGEVVARTADVPYTEYVDAHLLGPLGLTRTTWSETVPRAQGYLVDEYAGTALLEPHSDMGGVASMGQLWSTVGDLAGWATFLARGNDRVLASSSIEEMWMPQVMVRPDDWSVGWGIGLELYQHASRIFGGHTGAMPGFLAATLISRDEGVGAVVLSNSGTRVGPAAAALDLAATTLDLWPKEPEVWHPESEPPAEVRAILGRWWSEGNEFVFRWVDGKLTAAIPGAPARVRPSVFELQPDGGYRVVSGRELGERLRIEGEMLVWGGYPFTRAQEPTPG